MKTKLKFPVAKERSIFFPKEASCPVCRTEKVLEPHSMAIVNLSAVLMTNRKTRAGSMSDDLEGFLRLIWHGAHNGGTGPDAGTEGSLDIVEDARGGQADLYFCSTGCLRQFLNECVDELERRIEKVRKRTSLRADTR
ncbi:MAG: hypothetical protein HY695_34895 [Deltaproteobacteria bacterium]|nr:hypothetical protein [Deltaproteobacteria bacterium]